MLAGARKPGQGRRGKRQERRRAHRPAKRREQRERREPPALRVFAAQPEEGEGGEDEEEGAEQEEAALRFDLSPLDEEFLLQHCQEHKSSQAEK